MVHVSKSQRDAIVQNSKTAQRVLHLFSSDYRPLYVQNCMDLLALPVGARQRFRYRRDIVSLATGPTALDHADAKWIELGKKKTPVIVYFQSRKNLAYGEPVSVPIRVGKVLDTFVEGDYYFVDFEVGSYVDQAGFRPGTDHAPTEVKDLDGRKNRALALNRSLHPLLEGRQESAVLAPAPLEWGNQSDATTSFVSTARVMDDLLRRPRAPESAPSFMRVLGIRTAGGSSKKKWAKVKNGAYRLRSGTPYQLDTFQFRTGTEEGVEVRVELAPALEELGPLNQDLLSPYDVTSFEFLASSRDRSTLAKVSVRLNSKSEMLLPRALFTAEVVPRSGFRWWTAGIVLGTVLTTFILVLVSVDGLVSKYSADAAVLDLSFFPRVLVENSYLALEPGALTLACVAAIGSGLVAFGAAYRRRFGLDASS